MTRQRHTEDELRHRWLGMGVRALKAFGFPDVTTQNILTDYVYANAFKPVLREAREEAERLGLEIGVRVIDEMLAEIATVNL